MPKFNLELFKTLILNFVFIYFKRRKEVCLPSFRNTNLSWHTLISFRIHAIETKLDFVSFDDKNLQKRRKFVGERDFPIQNSYTGQVQCLSHSKDQKFVTSHCKALITERHRENAVQGLGKEATDSWVFDSRGNAIIMIIFRDLRKAFDTEGRTILLSKLSLIFRIESEYTLLVVHSPKPVPSNVVSPKGIYSVLYRSLSRSDHFVPRD